MPSRTGPLPRREKAGATAACVAGAVLLAVAVFLAVRVVPAGQRAEDAYRAAPVCAAGRSAPECIGAQAATVVGTREDGSRKNRHYALAVPDGPAPGPVRWIGLRNGEQLYRGARPGEAVTLYQWRGEVRAVAWRGVTWRTDASPVGSWGTALGWAAGLLPVGLALLAAGAWWLRRAARHPRVAPWQLNLIVLAGVLPAAFLGPWAAAVPTGIRTAWTVTVIGYGVALAVAAGCWAVLARAERRDGDTLALKPALPSVGLGTDAEPWLIRVWLPFEPDHPGRFLAVTEEGLFTTSDPTGRITRRRLPEPLTLVRARRRLRSDRPVPSSGRSFRAVHLAECRAGERTLLFAGRLPDLEQLAGALAIRSAPSDEERTPS
ncbi:hypothetical protein ABT095_07490 [Kitasatospora sp. NPDC002227]|uniref:hypothetical protein n=1 Tax=Kitasatospora sp. NPDC002227 TaxID=3154773 RepID=UPI003330C686